MTSHRRRRRETMPYSFKDKKHLFHGKEKSDGKGTQKVPLPLFQKSVYIDIKNGKQAEVMEDQLKKLGAVVEKFLSREVNYVISSSAPPTKTEDRQSNGDNPQSPSFASVPSPFSSIPSPTAPSDTKAAVVSRGKALAQIAYARSRASTIVANAEKWGIKVVSLEAATKWLDREIKKIEKEHGKDSTKKENEAQKPKKKVVKRKKKVLKGSYVKFEAASRMYRPMKSELERWPKLNLLAPPGLNPFSEVKMKIHNFHHRRHASLRNARASLSTSSGKGNFRKTCSMSSMKESISAMNTLQATPDVVAVPITTTGDVKRHLELLQRKRPDKLQGYCECCRMKYKDMTRHVKEDEHQSFARDKSNYESLDALIKQVPSTSQFLQEILLRHCAQKQNETVPPRSSSSCQKIPARLDIDVQPVISPVPSEATPPPKLERMVPLTPSYHQSPNVSKVKCNFAKSGILSQVESKEKHVSETEDSRPHAVVIRRPTPSGVFVSPRRREPTPSKKPWMQERSMVFGQSPMASLQPSSICSSIKFTVSESLLVNPFIYSNAMISGPKCDEPNRKSIVRSLVHLPDFVSSVSTDNERLSKIEEKKEIPVSNAPIPCTFSSVETNLKSEQNNMQGVDSHCENETGNDSCAKGQCIDTNTEDSFIGLENIKQKSPKAKYSPDVYIPCIAERVKRRVKRIQISCEIPLKKDHIEHDLMDIQLNSALTNRKEETAVGTCVLDSNTVQETGINGDCGSDGRTGYNEEHEWVDGKERGVDTIDSDKTEVYSPNQSASVENEILNEDHDEILSKKMSKTDGNESGSLPKESSENVDNISSHDKSDVIAEKYRNSKRTRKESFCQNTSGSRKVAVVELCDTYNSKIDSGKEEITCTNSHVSGNQSSHDTQSLVVGGFSDVSCDENEASIEDSNCILLSDISKNKDKKLQGDNRPKKDSPKKKGHKIRRKSSDDKEAFDSAETQINQTADEDSKCLRAPEVSKSKSVCGGLKHSSGKNKGRKRRRISGDLNSVEGDSKCLLSSDVSKGMFEHLLNDNDLARDSDVKKKGLERRKSTDTPSRNAYNKTENLSVEDNLNARKDKRKKGNVKRINSLIGEESLTNVAENMRSPMRRCRLFAPKGIYAHDGEGIDFSNNVIGKSKSDFMENQEMARTPESILKQKRSTTSDSNEGNGKVVSNLKNKFSKLTHSGRRIFRGNNFHSTNANWDVESEDRKNSFEHIVEHTITPNVAESVKFRRSCTLFNHEGKYANDGEGYLSKSDDNTNDIHCGRTVGSSNESEQTLGPALVVRRTPTSHSSLAKREATWCKLMSRKDWSQFEGDANSSTCEMEESGNDPSRENRRYDNNVNSNRTNRLSTVTSQKKETISSSPLSRRETVTHRSFRRCDVALNKAYLQVSLQRIKSECEKFKSPERGRDMKNMRKQRHHCHGNETAESNELIKKGKACEKSVSSDAQKSSRFREQVGTSSPRLRLKIRRDLNDCYSSTLEEFEEDHNASPKSTESGGVCKVAKNMFDSSDKIPNDSGSPNDPCEFEDSDSIDYLDTPRKGRRDSHSLSKYSSVTSLKLSPLQTATTHSKRDCHPVVIGNRVDVKANTKPVSSKLSLKKKRKHSDVDEMVAPVTPGKEDEFLYPHDVRKSPQEVENQFKDKSAKRRKVGGEDDDMKSRKKCLSQLGKRHKEENAGCNAQMASPVKGTSLVKSSKDEHLSGSCDVSPSQTKRNDREHDIGDKVWKQMGDDKVMVENASTIAENADGGDKVSPKKMHVKLDNKSENRKSKRKLSLSEEATDEAPFQSDKKKVKLNHHSSKSLKSKSPVHRFVEEPVVDPNVHCLKEDVNDQQCIIETENEFDNDVTEYENSKNPDDSHKSNEKLYSEVSGNNIGDLLNLVPNFSSPGKTNSSWDDACDSYLNTSLKQSNETPGKHGSINTSSLGASLLWSPSKHNSSATKSLNTLQKKGHSYHISSTGSAFPGVSPHGCLTPTKRKNSNPSPEASPLIQKVDSVISFNHMSPQRLQFSPVKLNSPVRRSEKSPLQKIDSDISFNHMSPQRLHFSPRKLELQKDKSGKSSARRHL